jgi:predicted transcriptional regulator
MNTNDEGPSATRTMAVKLDESTRDRLQRLARARDRSAHWMMREAIAQYLGREERREAFRQDGLRAWEEYQATGLHLTAAEAEAWLAELEAGGDAPPPECHA